MGSIIYSNGQGWEGMNGIAVGSGAYRITNLVMNQTSVNLIPYLNWHGEELAWSSDANYQYEVCNQEIIFVLNEDYASRGNMFLANQADIIILSKGEYEQIETMFDNILNDTSIQCVAGDPIMLTFNVSDPFIDDGYDGEELTIVDNWEVRMSLLLALGHYENGVSPYNTWLVERANGLWAYNNRTRNLLDMEVMLNTAGYSVDFVNEEGESILDDNPTSVFSRSLVLWVPNQKYEAIARKVQERLEEIGVDVILECGETDSAYDIKLDGIDVTNANTVYNTLLGKLSSYADELLDDTRFVANGQTYISLYANILNEFCRECTTRVNLGWENRMFIAQEGIENFVLPIYENGVIYSDFTPTGNISRIDFRGVTKI